MSKNYEKASFKRLLERLQEESWQLELLISGFAIFGLFYALDPINTAFYSSTKGGEKIFALLYMGIRLFIYIMIFNLLLHIILRGLWIGALGLRYVSGDIDYDELNYSKKFTNYLKRKVGSFDNYIGKLENYCSVIFAISFLLIFYVIAVFIIVAAFSFIGDYIIESENVPNWIAKGVGIPLIVFVIIGMILTFFDLITGGLLKKKQWVSKIYFPFYWVFSFLTLSFLYRPLVYNFLDNKFGRKISLLLLPFYLIIMITTSFYYQKSNYFTGKNKSNNIIANHNNYTNLKVDSDDFSIDFMIQSKVITDSYLKVTLPFHKVIENIVFKFNAGLKPDKDSRGLHSTIEIGWNNASKNNAKYKLKQDSLRVEYIKTLNTVYSLKIDSIAYKTDFIIDKISRDKFSFETYLGIQNLSEGKHLLTVSRLLKKGSVEKKLISIIPFWYFKE